MGHSVGIMTVTLQECIISSTFGFQGCFCWTHTDILKTTNILYVFSHTQRERSTYVHTLIDAYIRTYTDTHEHIRTYTDAHSVNPEILAVI